MKSPRFRGHTSHIRLRSTGGPPPLGSPQAGGPPLGTPGGPPPGTPGGPPSGTGGGPPTGTKAPAWLENLFELSFSLLYALDDSSTRDSFKNLRVLWTRALLHTLGKIEDPVAFELLPRKTRWVVGSLAAPLWKNYGDAVVDKLDWIVNRTIFIDSELEKFLDDVDDSVGAQVIVLGSGYDTRALRFLRPGVTFFEVDLPDIATQKNAMMARFLQTNDAVPSNGGSLIKHIPFDLNDISTKQRSLLKELKDTAQFRPDLKTMVIGEAVFFYLSPDTATGLMEELFTTESISRYCLTDNLAKFGVVPGPPHLSKQKCATWLERNGKELLAHDAIWGGAIHFVSAK